MIEPRVENVPAYATTAGDDAIDLARAGGVYLDDWQQRVLRQILGERPDDKWASSTVGLLVPRQNGKCVAEDDGVRCGEAATDVDHKRRGDDHRESNLQSLCGWHHARKTAKEASEARRPRPSARPPEAHPGLR
ncbi:HNH endonuclease [Nocardioides lijunqiniae]|uniref:HNH endonuclease n=1 Tax=Nocardioides lijunqiniae TaxID=2760832 RepID=UPI00187892BA|nr:hypothetical protein [Nocardioides lijunqiniae]